LKVEATRGLMVVGNRELIGQAVANLIDNAVKHGAPEDEAAAKTEISVVARRDGASVAIEVADHGPGIPPTTAPERSNVSCGWKARARGRAPVSACRSSPR